MRSCQLLASNLDVGRILNEILRRPDLWDENNLRTTHPGTAHSQVSDIWVWFNKLPKDESEVINDKEVIPYRAWKQIPALRNVIFALMRQVDAVRLGRVIITRLPPGKEITPHVDGGAPAEYYSRSHLAIQCLPGNIFQMEEEKVSFQTGQIWWIDNKKLHSVVNNSSDDRIVCIIDLRCE